MWKENKTLFGLLLLISSCTTDQTSDTSQSKPVYLTQDKFLIYYVGQLENGKSIYTALINWADGTLSGLTNYNSTQLNHLLVGELGLDERVRFTSAKDSAGLEMIFYFADPCQVTGTISDLRTNMRDSFSMECKLSYSPNMSGNYYLPETSGETTLAIFEISKNHLLYFYFDEHESSDTRLFGQITLSKGEWKSEIIYDKYGELQPCKISFTKNSDLEILFSLTGEDCEQEFSEIFSKIKS